MGMGSAALCLGRQAGRRRLEAPRAPGAGGVWRRQAAARGGVAGPRRGWLWPGRGVGPYDTIRAAVASLSGVSAGGRARGLRPRRRSCSGARPRRRGNISAQRAVHERLTRQGAEGDPCSRGVGRTRCLSFPRAWFLSRSLEPRAGPRRPPGIESNTCVVVQAELARDRVQLSGALNLAADPSSELLVSWDRELIPKLLSPVLSQ